MNKKLSLRKMAANRRNAQRSTGPRTPAGKRQVRWNALRHGILARELLAAGQDRQEQKELAALLAELRRDLRPRGALERALAEKVGVCLWRLRRVLRCESGEIHKGLAQAVAQAPKHKAWEVGLAASQLDSQPALAQHKLRATAWGLLYLAGILEKVRQEVERAGYLTQKAYQKLRRHFGGERDGLARRCLDWSGRITAALEQSGEVLPESQQDQEGVEPATDEAPGNTGEVADTEAECGEAAGDDATSVPAEQEAAGDEATTVPAEQEAADDATSVPVGQEAAAALSAEQCRKLIVDALWHEQLKLERESQRLQQEEEQQHQGHLATLSLPNEQGIRRIVRYEAALERAVAPQHSRVEALRDAAQRAVDPLGGPPKLPNKATQVLLNEWVDLAGCAKTLVFAQKQTQRQQCLSGFSGLYRLSGLFALSHAASAQDARQDAGRTPGNAAAWNAALQGAATP